MNDTAVKAWTFSDNPDDPCPYCVVWVEPTPEWGTDEAIPVWPDGSTAPLIYRFIHADCQRSVIEYVTEAAAER